MINYEDKLNPTVNRLGLGSGQESLYSLAVLVDGETPNVFIGSHTEIFFNLLQGIDMEEPAAVQVIPTQNKGKYIEHQGNLFKNINLKGTTGLRPNKNKPGAILVLPFGSTPGIPDNERTGFDDLVDLVNLFRLYFACKEDLDLAHKTTMIWRNGREGEYFVVEPLTFKTSRTSGSPMTTSYDIQLKTIERWTPPAVNRTPDLPTSESWRQKLKRHTANLSDAYAQVNALQDRLISVGARFITDILQPANDLLNAVTLFGETSRRISEVPRFAVANLASNVKSAAAALDEVAYNYNDGLADTAKFTGQQLRVMQRAIDGIYTTTELFSVEPASKSNRMQSAFDSTTPGRRRELSGGAAGMTLPTGGAALADINVGEDIRKVAKRLIGDAASWKALVILNDLKAPYISSTGDGVEVLRPGVDKILFPSAGTTSSRATTREPGSRPNASTLYGRDAKLGPMVNGVRDLAISQGGDIATIEGVANVSQAVDIKCNTEQGELVAHPNFGIRLPIGVRGNSAKSMTEFNIMARSTLLSDTRIAAINRLEFNLNGNTMLISGDVSLINGNEALSLNLEVRK